MADNHDTLIREVKAEIERERYENLWKKYGTYFIAAAAAIVLGVAGFQYWQASQREQQQKTGAAYDAALSLAAEKKYDEAAAEFARIAAETGGGYKILSQLQLAATYLDQKRTGDALAAFDRAANSGGDPIFTGFAALQAAALRLGTADFTEIENRLNGLISDQNPWRFSAREMLALAQLEAGKTVKARETLNGIITAPEAPQDMRDRMQILLDEIVAAETKKVADKPGAEGEQTQPAVDAAKGGAPEAEDGTAAGDAVPPQTGARKTDDAAGATGAASAEPEAEGASNNTSGDGGVAGELEGKTDDTGAGSGTTQAPSDAGN